MEQITAPAPSKVHFQKEILSNAIVLKGKQIGFEPIGSGRGILELDPADSEQKSTIDALTEFARRGVGGVSKITAQEYAEKKSLPPATPLRRPIERLRVVPRGPQRKPNTGDTAGVAQPANPPPPLPAMPPVEASEQPPTVDNPEVPVEKYSGFQPPTHRIARRQPDVKASPLP